jgi:hypothetical protein
MAGDSRTVSLMRAFLTAPSEEIVARIRGISSTGLDDKLRESSLRGAQVEDAVRFWGAFRRDDEWTSLLASLVGQVETERGRFDQPLAIWDDLEESGPAGRLLFIYLFAICQEGTAEYLRALGCPEDVVRRTFGVLGRHVGIHGRKFATTGVDAGWWMIPTLRGEVVHIGSLQFHRVTLGIGTLSPHPWYEEDETAKLGVGFHRGDPSVGIHIPEGTDLSPQALDATFQRARSVLSRMWPVHQRRLGTCQTWMLDDRLREHLPTTSNILRFQERFNLLPVWREDDDDVLEFVFREAKGNWVQVVPSTAVQAAVAAVLANGGHWRDRTGWLDFKA